uniref:Putative tail assembly n=1 Tax=viral metagenome TaxID=1070528 RepID=A0A6M3LHE2_9ZZZZ
MSESVTVKSYRKEREKEILDSLQKRLESVGRIVEKQAGMNVDKTGNEHPQVQFGNLLSSITHEVGDGEVTIGTNVKYGKYLEHGTSRMPPYPWLFPAVEMKRDEIIKTLKGDFAYEADYSIE